MSYATYDNTMISDTINTASITGPTPSPVYTTNIGGISSGAYWGINGTSASNTVLTSNGTGAIWAEPNLHGASIHVKGKSEFEDDANFHGDVKVKGKSLNESLERIEERLAILHPNEELEAKWEKLRELRKQYMELEADIIEKEKIWKILKD